jgi:hypothetical protein
MPKRAAPAKRVRSPAAAATRSVSAPTAPSSAGWEAAVLAVPTLTARRKALLTAEIRRWLPTDTFSARGLPVKDCGADLLLPALRQFTGNCIMITCCPMTALDLDKIVRVCTAERPRDAQPIYLYSARTRQGTTARP